MNENTSKFKNLIFSVFLQAGPWDQNKARKKLAGRMPWFVHKKLQNWGKSAQFDFKFSEELHFHIHCHMLVI